MGYLLRVDTYLSRDVRFQYHVFIAGFISQLFCVFDTDDLELSMVAVERYVYKQTIKHNN